MIVVISDYLFPCIFLHLVQTYLLRIFHVLMEDVDECRESWRGESRVSRVSILFETNEIVIDQELFESTFSLVNFDVIL